MQPAAIGPSSDFRRALGVPAKVRRPSARAQRDATLLSIWDLYDDIFVVSMGLTGDDGPLDREIFTVWASRRDPLVGDLSSTLSTPARIEGRDEPVRTPIRPSELLSPSTDTRCFDR
jgi:hypothetical protein